MSGLIEVLINWIGDEAEEDWKFITCFLQLMGTKTFGKFVFKNLAYIQWTLLVRMVGPSVTIFGQISPLWQNF